MMVQRRYWKTREVIEVSGKQEWQPDGTGLTTKESRCLGRRVGVWKFRSWGSLLRGDVGKFGWKKYFGDWGRSVMGEKCCEAWRKKFVYKKRQKDVDIAVLVGSDFGKVGWNCWCKNGQTILEKGLTFIAAAETQNKEGSLSDTNINDVEVGLDDDDVLEIPLLLNNVMSGNKFRLGHQSLKLTWLSVAENDDGLQKENGDVGRLVAKGKI